MPLQIVKLIDPIQLSISGTFTPKGTYNAGTSYSVGDQVDYSGTSYILYSAASAGTLPTDNTKWGVLAEKGAAGTNGTNGQGVPTGGTTGQQLAKINGTDYNTQWVNPVDISGKQDTLVSGTTIKTINSTSILGSGDIVVAAGSDPLKEDLTNKDTTTTLGTSDTKYPSQKAVKTYVDTAMSAVPEIVEGTGIDIQDIGGGVKSVAVDSTLLTTISNSAPKASPTFTGLVTSTDNMLVSNGRFTFDKFFGSPYFTLKNSSSDTQPIISLAGSGYNNFAYTKNAVGLWLGAGSTTAPDVNLYRDSANVLKTDDAFVAVGTITGSNLSGTNTGDLTEISDSEITVGTGTALRAMSGRRANKIITTANANASKYVSSQGGGLVTNGSGLYGDNTNFTGYTYLATDKPTGASGSFKTPNTSQNLGTTDELIAVDPFQRYRYSFSAKQISGSGNFYGAVVPYDVDKLQITPSTYMVQAGTLTTLAVELKAGDTTMTLTDATNWYNGGGSSYLRRAIFWNYTDSTGYTWPAETYSQNNTGNDFWNSGGISGNVVTLKTTYAGVTVPVGTAVSNGSDGSTYMYIGATNVAGPASWTNYSGNFGGAINPSTTAASIYLPISTAYIRAGFLYNVSGSSSYQAFANINLRVIEKLDTDGTLTANSDSVIASQKAVKTYTDKKGVLAYDVFSSSGTWTKPSGAKVVEVYAIGGGGGGGKGTSGSEGTARYGGGGGGAGGLVFASLDATTLTGTVTVTVGTGGSGGTTDGGFNTGGNGTATTFGAYVSGGGGTGGSSGAMVLGYGTGGTAGASSYVNGSGGASLAGVGALLSMPGVSGHMGGGAGGAGRTAANAYTIAVGGGSSSAGAGGSGGGTTVGTAGTAGTNGTGTNGGAGGGGGGPTAVGGAGGTNGGGGGGGGCAISPATSGNGGAGGAGSCIVVTYG